MNARTLARLFFLAALAAAAALPSWGRAGGRAGGRAEGRAGAPAGGADLDDVPPGLTADAEAAWVFEHTPVIRVPGAPAR
jgi:hypothetical protein